jgi:predicted DNA-binding transcriptional regulator
LEEQVPGHPSTGRSGFLVLLLVLKRGLLRHEIADAGWAGGAGGFLPV